MLAAALAFCLTGPVSAAPSASKADAASIELVQRFVKTPTADLPPEAVPDFLAVDPASLPPKLRDPFETKRLELLALKRYADGRSKPTVRRMGMAPSTSCDPPQELNSAKALGAMKATGFNELKHDEVAWLQEQTGCSECELQQEFSLTLVRTPEGKRGLERRTHYLLLEQDPLMSFIAAYRSGQTSVRTTSFFGIGGSPKCR